MSLIDRLDFTHNKQAVSWVETATNPSSDFPIQNLPLAVFRRAGSVEPWRGGVAIGDQIVDLAALMETGLITSELAIVALLAAREQSLEGFMALGPVSWRALRHALFNLLSNNANPSIINVMRRTFVLQDDAEFSVPANIRNFTDFYTSLDHARNVGVQIRTENPVSPNFFWMPIAYHGRASSIRISPDEVRRPLGQTLQDDISIPVCCPSVKLDYELELGTYIGQGNNRGEPISLSNADDHIFGICLLNDWSARDIQRWESHPLGPFQAKNFATTISPWIVTVDALAPYRLAPIETPKYSPTLPYLDGMGNRQYGAFNIQLEVSLIPANNRMHGRESKLLSRTNFRHQYWTIAQMIAHHTYGGCNLQPGDLIGSGTISGPTSQESGSLIELTHGGRIPVDTDGVQQRTFLEDGDEVILRGWCETEDHARIGFENVEALSCPP